jgi:ribosomal protein S18 acetylase RimI-like enzyme
MNNTRSLTVGEHNLIGDIISESFADDPVNLWVFGGKVGMHHYYSAMAKKLYLPRGHGYVVDDEAGGCLWLPPGENKQLPLLKSFDMGMSLFLDCGLKTIKRGMTLDNALAKAKPKEPHYYLFAIGTRPSHQGKGVGKKLMETGLKRVDDAGRPAYLESSKEANIPFYQRYGFEVVDKLVAAKDSPPMWLMWREAK